MYFTLSQTSLELNRSERQVRYLVKSGILTPVNTDTYKRDGGYRFSIEEIEKVKNELKVEGISLREAADIVGISPQYLNTLAIDGRIQSELVLIGRRHVRRFKEPDCLQLAKELCHKTDKRLAQFGSKLSLFDNNLRLFELIPYKGEMVRIIKTNPITLLKSDATLVYPVSIGHSSYKWPNIPYVTKKGFIVFQIPIPRNAEHKTYHVLYKLINGLGQKNIQVFEQEEGDYIIRCRPASLPLSKEDTKQLNRYLIEGELNYICTNTAQLDSNLVSQYIHIPKDLFQEAEKIASTNDLSTQELIVQAIERGLHSLKTDK